MKSSRLRGKGRNEFAIVGHLVEFAAGCQTLPAGRQLETVLFLGEETGLKAELPLPLAAANRARQTRVSAALVLPNASCWLTGRPGIRACGSAGEAVPKGKSWRKTPNAAELLHCSTARISHHTTKIFAHQAAPPAGTNNSTAKAAITMFAWWRGEQTEMDAVYNIEAGPRLSTRISHHSPPSHSPSLNINTLTTTIPTSTPPPPPPSR